MPETLVHGSYARHDASPPDPKLAQAMSDQVTEATPEFAAYLPVPENRGGLAEVTLTGVYGTVTNPVTAREQLLDIKGRAYNLRRVVVPVRTTTPPGAREPLRCRVLLIRWLYVSSDSALAECSWADSSAVVVVASIFQRSVQPEDVDLDAVAADVAAMREEVRAPR
ncbi:hypothetical protein [Streptomyces sp. NRRL WC-3742]|uniref:hypothetical protein n=1 Tax=Streptomyces sp. NRRL WC-3742 TaxID=1463934 RepID=UPI0004C5FBB1|nr:hypothetical protein [Streptomyces sp. NRRL WC-3742]